MVLDFPTKACAARSMLSGAALSLTAPMRPTRWACYGPARGFDIAGLCGVFLGGALENVPILMDGFISGVAALCAVRLCPAAAKAVFASHVSSEPAARLVLEKNSIKPLITANLHLGEGTGAVASLPLWDMALAVYNGCYSFAEGGITPYTPQC